MAHKTCSSQGATYRIDRRIPGVGRLAIASGATTRAGLKLRLGLLDQLVEKGRLDVLHALKAGTVRFMEALDANRRDDFDGLFRAADPLDAPLWTAVEAWAPLPVEQPGQRRKLDPLTPQRRRGRVAFAALRRLKVLPETATMRELASVEWASLQGQWPGSGSDWNHLRKAVSKFLSDTLRDKWHPFRRSLIERIPRQAEPDRVPDLSPALFWKILRKAPEPIRPAYVLLAHTGIDVGPYLRLTKAHLDPETHHIRVPDTKTSARQDVVSVDPRLWGWIEAAVPAPVQYKALRRHWKVALAAAEADTSLRLKDLRHCLGQWATDAGISEAKVQVALRHANPSMTRRYTKTRDKGEVAQAVADAMLKSA